MKLKLGRRSFRGGCARGGERKFDLSIGRGENRCTLWLSTGSVRDKRKWMNAHRAARKAMRTAKNGGKIVWRCIKDIQRGRRGLIPLGTTATAAVRDEVGAVYDTQNAATEMEEAFLSDSESPE